MSDSIIYSAEVQNMCVVAKGPNHGPAPIPEEGKWVQAKEITDISGHLRQKCQQRKQQNKHRIDNPLRNNRTHTTTEIRPLVTLQHTTTQHLTHTRHNQAAGITQENSMHTSGQTRTLAGRNKHLAPPHSTQHLRQNTKRQRQKHPRPQHLVRNSIRQFLPTNTTIHPPQYACRQSQRHTYFEKLSYPLHVPNELFFISLPCKSTKN